MNGNVPCVSHAKQRVICLAAAEFFIFQNARYPRKSALEWVGNRHNLTRKERELLHRGVFDQKVALRRRAKRCLGSDWRGHLLVVDGHNVHITIESWILGRPLLLANDGALRDLAGQSSRFRLSEASELALDIIFRFLGEFRPAEVLFLFDAPMSQSGFLAGKYRERINRAGLAGDAKAVPVPERLFPYQECVVASSDQAVLEASQKWLDLARAALNMKRPFLLDADFSKLLLSNR